LFSQNNSNTSAAMLNYLATQSRVILSSKNNRLALEDMYNMLINNTNPGIVDQRTQYHMEKMLDDIQRFRLISLQRDRLQFLLENSQAQAITKAMPNPLYMLGSIRDINPVKIIATVALMTLDSVMQYQNAKNEAEIQFLKDNWELDDNESDTIHNLRKETFSFMIDIARAYSLESSDTLNEQSIDAFVSYKFDENLQRRRQALESNRSIYYKYGPYWLELADTYYKLEMYQDCIRAIREYEIIKAPLYRKDYSYAEVLPFVIISAFYVYNNPVEYSAQVTYYLEKLVENTTESQWQLRYFAAQNYLLLASISNKDRNMRAAYALLLDNVRFLSHEQEKLLEIYNNPIDERIARGLTKTQENQAKRIINELKRKRRTELPPLHEALVLNYMALFPLMQEMQISQQQRNDINAILGNAFVSPILKYNYFNLPYEIRDAKLSRVNIFDTIVSLPGIVTGSQSWREFTLELPAVYVAEGSDIHINIQNDSRAYPMRNIPYTTTEVVRGRNAALPEYTAKIRIPLSDEIIIERGSEYSLRIEIAIADVSCSLVFLSPVGRMDFVFDHVE